MLELGIILMDRVPQYATLDEVINPLDYELPGH
jgi:hypothetical protein